MTVDRLHRVDEVATLFNGKTPSKAQQRDSGHPVLKIKDVDELGTFRGEFSGHIDPELAQKHTRQQIKGGETLILNAAHSSTHVASKTYFADGEVVGSLATGEWLIIRWEQGDADPRYGHHWVTSPQTRFSIRRLVNGIHLYPKDVARLKIPLPPLEEQKRIAAILDAADDLRAKRRESLAQLDALLQSTFLDMFGDPAKNGWEMVTVTDVSKEEKGAIRTGPFGSQLLHSEFVDEGIRVLGIDNAVSNTFKEGEPRFITPQKYKKLRRYTVKPGDVLITIMGTCGRCAVVPDDIGDAINTKHLCCISLNLSKCLPEFMHTYFLQHPIARRYLERSAKGAIMSGLNMGIIKATPIPLPPTELQHRFAAIVKSVEGQKVKQRAHLDELDTLFASLQTRAFAGELI